MRPLQNVPYPLLSTLGLEGPSENFAMVSTPPPPSIENFWVRLWSLYSGTPLMRPPLENGKRGHIRGVAIGEGGIKMINEEFVLQNCSGIRRVAPGESGCI